LDKKILDKQAQHWENTFINRPETFGVSPSAAAIRAAEIFNKKDITNILELGAGQGRDTLFFAQKGFHIQVLDYSQTGLDNIIKKAKTLGVDKLITGKIHDVRNPLPFTDKKFGGCFSHMLYCMALTTKELKFLSDEIHRVLNNGGVNIYTVRHTGDGDYKNGIHRGEDLYESSGFIVHFFSKEKVKQLSNGFDIVNIENFEEGKFPRKLFRVTLKKV
jgi:SAM-dependent methyltransferase